MRGLNHRRAFGFVTAAKESLCRYINIKLRTGKTLEESFLSLQYRVWRYALR
jgi:hypothetical protein